MQCGLRQFNFGILIPELTKFGENIMSDPCFTSERAVWLERFLVPYLYSEDREKIGVVVDAMIPHLSPTGIDVLYELLNQDTEDLIRNYGGTK